MKTDTSGIALADLAAHLGEHYGRRVASLAFIPKGEDAYAYLATDADGERLFVRAQPESHNGHAPLEEVYAALATLRNRCGVTPALAPLPTPQGRFTNRYGAYTVALFPYIEGSTAYETNLDEAQWRAAAETIAALPCSAARCALPPLARETFANPFAVPIERALRRATADLPPASPCQAQVIALLRAQQEDVRATLRHMAQMRQALLRLAPPMAPSHGDPNLANLLIDEAGALHLTDWGELALAPPERDLMAFIGERFAPFLRHYLQLTGPVQLHRRLFAFYLTRWALQEIADYTTRILFGPGDPAEEAHAWQDLQPYLPNPHAAIAADLAGIDDVLQPLAAERVLQADMAM